MPPGRSPTGPPVGPVARRPRPWCRSAPRRRASSRRSPRTGRGCRARTRGRTARPRTACRGGRTPPSGTSRRARRGGGSAPPRPRPPPGPSCRLDLLGREPLAPPLGRRARREVAERLTLVVRGLVEGEDPQQGLVELPVRDLLEHDLAEARVGPEPAADADVHRLDELAVDLLEHALDADVGDLLLRAARRAAREVQAEVLAVAVLRHVRVEEARDLRGARLRVHLREAAELLAR